LAGFVVIGTVGGGALRIDGLLDVPVSELRDARESGLTEWV
jgi:hypothetical protein